MTEFTRDGRIIRMDGKGAIYVERWDTGGGPELAPYQVESVAVQLCNALRVGVIAVPDTVEQADALSLLPRETRDVRAEEQAASLKETGRCAHESLAEMVAALECDYDRLEELRATRGDGTESHRSLDTDEAEELRELESAAGDCESRDDAEQRIQEDPLSIEVRDDWMPVGAEADGPTEFRILLATGGPAVRIIGVLNAHGEPIAAGLQTQDWFTPWTDYREADEAMLLTYCRCFYFGEG